MISLRTLILPYKVLVLIYAEKADTAIIISTRTRIVQNSSESETCASTAARILGEIYRLIRFRVTKETADSKLSTRTFFSPDVHASRIINHTFCPIEYFGFVCISFGADFFIMEIPLLSACIVT